MFTAQIAEKDLRTISHWAKKLEQFPFWGKAALEELLATEFRVGVYLDADTFPVAYASITPEGTPDGCDRGALWFDHLYVDEHVRGRGLVDILFRSQLDYVRRYPKRRILCVPMDVYVAAFWERRGWQKYRDALHAPLGVYELPRVCVGS